MKTVNYIHLFSIVCSCILLVKASTFNLDELNSAYYNVTILSVPVIKTQLNENAITIVNKHGQEYECIMPKINIKSGDTKKDEKSEESINVSELLKPMESAPCLVKRINWWTYEFCYGSTIKQYHVEDHKVIGPIMILGQYESEYNWKNNSEAQNKLQKFHTQLYVNGTRCDITGELRRTEVRFLCDEAASDHIKNVDEPESCRYLIVIGTSRLCHHPFMKNRLQQTPYPINCAPSLTADQHKKYLQVQKDKEEKMEEAKQQEKSQTLPTDSTTEKIEDLPLAESTEKPTEKLNEGKVSVNTESHSPPLSSTTETEEPTLPQTPMKPETSEIFEDQSANNMKTENIKDGDSNSEKVIDELVKMFGEARKEFSNSADLVDKLMTNSVEEDDTVSRIKMLQKKLQETSKGKDASHISDIEKMLDMLNSAVVLAQAQTYKITKQVKQIESFLHKKISEINKLLEKDSPEQTKNEKKETISQMLRKHFSKGEDNIEGKSNNEDDKEINIIKEAVLDENKKQKLEQRIKERLQKSGIDVGQKIEVKIITPTYMTEDQDDELIPTDDKESLKTLIFNFLAANDEEELEQVRHQNLIQNYNFDINNVVNEESSAINEDTEPSENKNSDTTEKP